MTLARSLFWGYANTWGKRLISLLVFIILARLLEPKDFGLVAFAKLFVDYLDAASGQGLGLALIQRKNLSDTDINTAFWLVVCIGSALFILLMLISPFISGKFGSSELTSILQALSLVILINALSRTQVALMTKEQRFRSLAARGMVGSIGGGIVGISLAISGWGAWSLVGQQLTTATLEVLMLWWTANWRPRIEFCRTSARELYRFASRAFADRQIQFFSTRLDEALIAALLGVSSLGYYSIAKKLYLTVGGLIYSALPKVLLAVFSKEQDQPSKLLAKAQRTVGLAATMAYPLFLGAAATGQMIISTLFGSRWNASSLTFSILMISGVLLLNQHILHPVFHALGKPAITMKLSALKATISAPLIIIGSLFGILGVSIAVATANSIGVLLDMWIANRLQKGVFKLLMLENLKAAAYCLPMLCAVTYASWLLAETVHPNGILALTTCLGVMIYMVTLRMARAPLVNIISRHARHSLPFVEGR